AVVSLATSFSFFLVFTQCPQWPLAPSALIFFLFPCFLFSLHHHHWHFSIGNRGFFACATAASNVSSTQISSCCFPILPSLSYSSFGSCFASCGTLRIPSSSKSRSMAGPIEIRSFSSRSFSFLPPTFITTPLTSVPHFNRL